MVLLCARVCRLCMLVAVCWCGGVPPAFAAVFILSTSENFPDIMFPAYRCNPFNVLYFVAFIVIGVYFILNLVLAVAYTEFMERTKDKVPARCTTTHTRHVTMRTHALAPEHA